MNIDLNDPKIEEIRFFIFTPHNVEDRVKSFTEARQAIFKKYDIDPLTKEKTAS